MSQSSSAAARHWPLFDLVVRTPRLTLRYADDERVAALMDLAVTAGIHGPNEMPFATPWTRRESPQLERQGMQYFWQTRATTGPETWALNFAVFEDDRLVGSQEVVGHSFAVTRTVETGSWLARPVQGQGIGKEMRAAVLHLAFAGLHAEYATTSVFSDNPASIGVTRSLGYVDNGWKMFDREGKPARHLQYILDRATWETRRRNDIEIQGLQPCLALLGLDEVQDERA